jgi:hypothetical protein
MLFTVWGAGPLAVVLAIAIRHIAKGRGPLLLFCLIGGATASLFEPSVDAMGLVYLPENGSMGTFSLLGPRMAFCEKDATS